MLINEATIFEKQNDNPSRFSPAAHIKPIPNVT